MNVDTTHSFCKMHRKKTETTVSFCENGSCTKVYNRKLQEIVSTKEKKSVPCQNLLSHGNE